MRWLWLFVFWLTACSHTADTAAAPNQPDAPPSFQGKRFVWMRFSKDIPTHPFFRFGIRRCCLTSREKKVDISMSRDWTGMRPSVEAGRDSQRLIGINALDGTFNGQKYTIFLGDENNDERINVYRMDMDTGAIQALIPDYVYGYSISQDKNRLLGFLERGEPVCFLSKHYGFRRYTNTEIVCDTPEAKFMGCPQLVP